MTIHFINQLITPTILVIFSLGFFVIWYQFRHIRSARLFALSYMLAAFAFSGEFFMAKNTEASLLRLAVDHLYLLSVMVSVIAFATRVGKPAPIKALLVVHAITSGLITGLYAFSPDIITKAYIISSACSFMMAMAVPLTRAKMNVWVNRVLYYAVVISALQLMVNAAVVAFIDKGLVAGAPENTNSFISIINFSVILISLTIAVSLFISYGHEIISAFKEKSEKDGMTGVLNRAAFEEIAHNQLTLARRVNLPLTLVVADIDFFKQVNDTYGHATGDEVIKSFASTLQFAIRSSDIVGRVGGEEFCILLSSAPEPVGKMLAQAARTAFEQGRYIKQDSNKSLTASFGVAEFRPGETYNELFERTDQALYASKQAGRNRVTCSSEMLSVNHALLSA